MIFECGMVPLPSQVTEKVLPSFTVSKISSHRLKDDVIFPFCRIPPSPLNRDALSLYLADEASFRLAPFKVRPFICCQPTYWKFYFLPLLLVCQEWSVVIISFPPPVRLGPCCHPFSWALHSFFSFACLPFLPNKSFPLLLQDTLGWFHCRIAGLVLAAF